MVPIVQIHTQSPPIRISSLAYQLYQLFKILTHTEVVGSPIGSLTTIHTNIPAITVTVLAVALWNVIRLLYVYAYISLSGYMTKLLVVLLQQLSSLQYESMIKIRFLKTWQKSPPQTHTHREIFLDWIYPFQTISSNFGFGWQKSSPHPTPRWPHREMFLYEEYYARWQTTCQVW